MEIENFHIAYIIQYRQKNAHIKLLYLLRYVRFFRKYDKTNMKTD